MPEKKKTTIAWLCGSVHKGFEVSHVVFEVFDVAEIMHPLYRRRSDCWALSGKDQPSESLSAVIEDIDLKSCMP